jgi:hypothetical protein
MTEYNEPILIFIYRKKKKMKVLDLISAEAEHDKLIKKGWEHIASINISAWIIKLLEAENPMEMIDELRRK